MISALIATQDHERALGPLLAALVPAAVDGLVRQVIVIDGGSGDATLDIARDSGADVIELRGSPEARLAAGCAQAKADWLLILQPGAAPPSGWAAAAREHMELSPASAAWFAPGRGGWLGGPPKSHALLLPRRLLDQAGGYSAGLPRRLGRRLKRLKPAKNRL